MGFMTGVPWPTHQPVRNNEALLVTFVRSDFAVIGGGVAEKRFCNQDSHGVANSELHSFLVKHRINAGA